MAFKCRFESVILFLIKLFYNNLYIRTKTIKITLIVECDIVFIFYVFLVLST